MSFELRLAEDFWRDVRERLSLDAQEAVLDCLEDLRSRPGDLIDRSFRKSERIAVTRPIPAVVDGEPALIRVGFQYGDDESTLYVRDLIIEEDDTERVARVVALTPRTGTVADRLLHSSSWSTPSSR